MPHKNLAKATPVTSVLQMYPRSPVRHHRPKVLNCAHDLPVNLVYHQLEAQEYCTLFP